MIYLVSTQQRLFEDNTIQLATVQDCLDYFKDKSIIEVDTETTGFNPHSSNLICLQLGDQFNQFVIDCNCIDIIVFKELLENKEKLFILQNAQFDLRFLYHKNIYINNIYDLFLVECVLTTGLGDKEDIKDIKEDCGKKDVAEKYADRKVGLNDLAQKYLGKTISKDIRGIIHKEGLSYRVIKYAAGDVDSMNLIRIQQLKELESFKTKYNTTDEIINLENNVVKVFARLLYNGININYDKYYLEVVTRVNTLLKEAEEKLNYLIKSNNITNIKTINPTTKRTKPFQIVFGGDLFNPNYCNINWNSPEQKLGILKYIDPTVTSSAYAEINKRSDKHPIFKELIHYNKYKKLQDSFGKDFLDFINPKTGRIHSSIWQILSTGRISMSDPNLAQIPSKGELGKVIRSCFIPRNKDYIIVGGDYSGMELRIIAEFSQDPLWIKTFQEGGDLHSVLCAETFDIDIKDVKKPFYANPDITYRDVQKTLNFGLAYGMSKYKLSDTILISVDDAEQVINKFFSKVPKVKQFLNNLGNLATTRGYIKTSPPYSRVRRFPKWEYLQNNPYSKNKKFWLGEIERAGKNTPIQGSNGDILKLALILLQEEIDNNNWDVNILLSVYDEIQTEANRNIAEEWKKTQDSIMIKAAQTVIKTIPVVVDCKISECWQK